MVPIYSMSEARSSDHSVGKGVPDSFWLSPPPPGVSGECTPAPARVSYPGSALKILVSQDTLNEGSTRERTAEKAQLALLFLLHCPARPFSLGIRDRTSKAANLCSAYPPPAATTSAHPFRKLSNHRDKPFKRWAQLQFVNNSLRMPASRHRGTQSSRRKRLELVKFS